MHSCPLKVEHMMLSIYFDRVYLSQRFSPDTQFPGIFYRELFLYGHSLSYSFTGKFVSVENSLNLMKCACRSLFFLEFLDAFHSLVSKARATIECGFAVWYLGPIQNKATPPRLAPWRRRQWARLHEASWQRRWSLKVQRKKLRPVTPVLTSWRTRGTRRGSTKKQDLLFMTKASCVAKSMSNPL